MADRLALDCLFRPRSIAVVGASPNLSFVANIYRNILRHGFPGPVYPVNSRQAHIGDAPCFPTVRDLPQAVDLVIVGVPERHVPHVLADCEARGVGAVDIISSGYAESSGEEGARRQRELRAFAHRTGIRLVGPNCLGLMSVPGRMMAIPTYTEGLKPGPVALVLQSGMMVPSVIVTCHDRDMGFTYVVTSGNEADLDAADYMEYFVEDAETRVIGGFIEEIRDVDKLIRVARRAAELNKPIVVLKIGRSEAGRRAALAHTGSLVGSDRAIDALFRREGITRVRSVDELVEALAIFHTPKRPGGSGAIVVSVSGGVSGLFSDLVADCGVYLPELLPETAARLRRVVPRYGNVGNPLDITGQGVFEVNILEGSLACLAEAENIHVILHARGFPAKLDAQGPVGKALTKAVREYPDKLFLIASLPGGAMHENVNPEVPQAEPVNYLDGVPFLQGAEPALKAVAALVRYADFQRGRASHPSAEAAAGLSEAGERARAMVEAAPDRVLAEHESKQLLALYGIPIPEGRPAASLEEALEAARALGYPLALKVDAEGLAHKSDVGGVTLGIVAEDGLRSAYERMMASVRASAPGARIRGVLVERMAPAGQELILGMVRDQQVGPTVMIGMGGLLAEVLEDTALRLPPLAPDEARAVLAELRGYRSLLGARGAPPADLDALADVIQRFAVLCRDLDGMLEAIEINPLAVFAAASGVMALDCLAVRSLDHEEKRS